MAFQIQDDLLNLEGETFKSSKGYSGEDIHEGKVSLMVIHFLQNASAPKQTAFMDILKAKTQDQQQIEAAIALLRETNSL